MKKILFAILTIASISVNAQQTAETIIEKYTAALGGMEAFAKPTTAKMTGAVSIQGMDLPMTMQIVNGKAMRMDVEAMGQTVTQAYNNGKGWQVNPFANMPSPTEVTGDELIGYKAQSYLANGLADYKSRGHQVALAGEETVEGVKTWKINLTNKDNGKVSTYFISTSDYTLIKLISSRNMNGQEVQVENWYSNYKSFGGGKYAMSMVQKVNGDTIQEISWNNIELNVKIDETIFDQ